MSRLISAEVLKLRRRRGTLACAVALTFGVVALMYLWSAQGGAPALRSTGVALVYMGSIAGILLGCAAGAGDADSGLLRELVATGCSRRALFAARLPALLAIVVPLSLLAAAFAGGLALLLAGDAPGPSLSLIVKDGLWVTTAITFAAVLTLGVAAAVGNQATTVGTVVGFHLLASLMIIDVPAIGPLRHWIPLGAIARLEPSPGHSFPGTPVSLVVLALLLWTAAAIGAGGWRTATQDA